MKKFSVLLFAAVVAVAGLVSCEPTDGVEELLNPKISVKAEIGDFKPKNIVDQHEIEEEEGTPLVFVATFEMGVAKLTAVKVTSTIDNKTFAMIDTTLNEGLFNGGDKTFEFTYETNVGTAKETVVFSTTDKKGSTAEFTVNIKPKTIEVPKVEAGEKYAYVTKENIKLGAQKNVSLGSFYSFGLNKPLTISAAKASSELVDFVYYYGTKNEACIASPNDPETSQIFTLAKKNATKFAKVTKSGANATNAKDWYEDAITGGLTETKAAKLQKSDVYVFETADKVQGAFVVTDVETKNTGAITITLIKQVEVK